MSPFIPIIESLVLSDSPPESNVIPLPTRATVPRTLPGGSHVSFTNRGSSIEPRLTPSSPPSFSSSMAARSSTSMSNPLRSASSSARVASAVGVSVPPGWFDEVAGQAHRLADGPAAAERGLHPVAALAHHHQRLDVAGLGIGLERRVAVRPQQRALGHRLRHGGTIEPLGHAVEHVDGEVRLAAGRPGQRRGRPAVGGDVDVGGRDPSPSATTIRPSAPGTTHDEPGFGREALGLEEPAIESRRAGPAHRGRRRTPPRRPRRRRGDRRRRRWRWAGRASARWRWTCPEHYEWRRRHGCDYGSSNCTEARSAVIGSTSSTDQRPVRRVVAVRLVGVGVGELADHRVVPRSRVEAEGTPVLVALGVHRAGLLGHRGQARPPGPRSVPRWRRR